MFINHSQLDQLASADVDIAIVGAGPAGITLALKLSKAGRKVLLIEAGGFNFPKPEDNDPYNGHTTSRPYPLTASRLRFFGGTSNHWGGWVRPLDKEDFEVNSGIPYSGWPINYNSLKPYYDEAHRICEVPVREYDLGKIKGADSLNLFAFNKESNFRNSVFRFSPPTRFGQRYRKDIEDSNLIFCALNTQLLRIDRGNDGKCKLILLNSIQKRLTVYAKSYVLAMGGVENARTLLYSNAMSSTDLGGAGDWVGRCFMDHFALTTSIVLAKPEINYSRTLVDSSALMAIITPSPIALKEAGTNNFMIDITPTKADESLGTTYHQNLGIFANADRGWHYSLKLVTAGRPNRNSRVRLGSDLDINGVPRTSLEWNIEPADFDNAFSFIKKFSSALGVSGQGRIKTQMKQAPAISRPLSVGMHHIGTTRMAASEEEGVVDQNCKVYGTTDLYIAGSSVFPTSGYSNPTLTIVALAVRLADHLHQSI